MKAQIYTGAPATGKTRVAYMIASFFSKEKVAIMSGRKFTKKELNNAFLFSEIPDTTEMLIIDDLPSNFDFSFFFPVIDERPYGGDLYFQIPIHRQGEKPKNLKIPFLIFTMEKLDITWSHRGASFDGRFDIVQFPLSAH